MDETKDTNKISSPAEEEEKYQEPPSARSKGFVRGLLFLALLGVSAFGAFGLQHQRLKQIQMNPPYIDDMFLPQKEYAKTLAFGYDMFMADFLFVRSIQAFGAQYNVAEKQYDSVIHYFDTITELDPLFTEAYEFGSLVMTEGNHPQAALNLNRKGWAKDRSKYRLAFLNAYTAVYEMDDLQRGPYWVNKALTSPDAPDWLERWPVDLFQKMGRYKLALESRIRDYLGSLTDSSRKIERMIALTHVKEIANDWNLAILNDAVANFMKDNDGRVPVDLGEVERAGYLNNYRACQYSQAMFILDEENNQILFNLKEKRGVENLFDLTDFVLEKVAPTLSGIPFSPHQTDEQPDYYYLRKDLEPDNYAKALEGKVMVLGYQDGMMAAAGALNFVRGHVEAFFNREARYPDTLEEAFPQGLTAWDPKARTWNYDPKTGEVKSPTYPEL